MSVHLKYSMIKHLILLWLAIAPVIASANSDCNDKANEVRLTAQLDQAIDILDDCLAEELGRVARTYLLLGLTHYDAGEQRAAIANYSKAIEFAPEYVTAFANRGLSNALLGNFRDAIADYDTAIDLDPGYMQAYYFRAYTHQQMGDFREAIADFTTALTLTRDNDELATLYYSRGRANKEAEYLVPAMADYDQAIALKPAQADYYFSRGLLHHQQKSADAAIADYSRAIELDDRHARAYYNRGLLYRKAGTDFLALRDFEAATDIEPSFARAYANRGYTHMIPLLPLLIILALG